MERGFSVERRGRIWGGDPAVQSIFIIAENGNKGSMNTHYMRYSL